MEGTIKIESLPGGVGVSCNMELHNVSRLDMLGVFDALMEGFRLDKADRMLMCAMLAVGGVSAVPGAKSETIEMDKDLLEILKTMKESRNEPGLDESEKLS